MFVLTYICEFYVDVVDFFVWVSCWWLHFVCEWVVCLVLGLLADCFGC